MHFTVRFIMAACVTLVFLAGCAEKGPILLDVRYQAPEGMVSGKPKVVVGVSPFKDDRGKQSSVLGKRTIAANIEDDFMIKDSVAELATARLKDALKARGFIVKDLSWDRTEQGIKSDGADILLGGEIKTLGVDTASKPFKTAFKAVVQMRILVADTAAKKIIKTFEVSSKLELEDFYSREKVENMLSEALSAALDQIFKDEELKKKMQ
jgi:uncharacterized lipoprotein YajG